MNILFINSGFLSPTTGGVERVTYDLGNWLAGRGHRVYCLIINGDLPTCLVGYISCFRLPVKGSWANGENLNVFQAFLEREKIQVVINQSEMTQGSDLCELAVPQSIPVINVWHTSPPTQRGDWDDFWTPLCIKHGVLGALLRMPTEYMRYARNSRGKSYECQMLKKRYERSCFFVTLSNSFHQELIHTGNLGDGSKLVAIPNPVHLPLADYDHAKEKIVLWVGRMTFSQKRPDRMVRIWEKITVYFPEWTLYMLGDGDARHILEKYCERKHIPRIVFAGRQDSTKWYQRASLLCMTSSWEGWGLVLTEAMSYGCVPIAYNSFSSLQDIVQNNKNGVAVNAFAGKDYIEDLGHLMADNDWREQLADNACRSIKNYSIDNVGAQWEKLLHSLI